MDFEFELGNADALLIIGDSERNVDLYYATSFRAPDPFVFLWTNQAKIVMTSDLELDRARDQAKVDHVISRSQYEKRLNANEEDRSAKDPVLLELLRDFGLQRLLVPPDFPIEFADFLRRFGIELKVVPAPVFPQRLVKTPAEIEYIRQSIQAAEKGMEAAIAAIRQATVEDRMLRLGGEVLTSERVRRLIHQVLLEEDCLGQHTIVAGGEKGCDPHQEGSGPLRPNEPIVIDIFPRNSTSGYFGDITRTVVKGEAPTSVVDLYNAVHRGQQWALGRIGAGVDGRQIHQGILKMFEEAGYKTGSRDGRMQGFFHGTGHGLGLEIHEPPRISSRGDKLASGQAVTVEPGLYYPGLGGVRIEDVVVVRDKGCENLTTFPHFLVV